MLVASPQLRDPNFQRAVVLLVQHNAQGALGIIVNREAPMRLGDVVADMEGLNPVRAIQPVLWGGPVERGVGFVVFRGEAAEGWDVGDGVAVSTSSQRLASLVAGGGEFLLCLGYAGWGPGQLDREFEEGSWVYSENVSEVLFDTDVSDRYDLVLARNGLQADTLWMNPVNE
jgi:putative transcriptional regulator